jgi:23S rRNA (pseudouridine1915-N3)-methyltransferase
VKVRVLAVGQRQPGWVDDGYAEYAKRLPPTLRPQLIELPAGHRKAGTVHRITALEADKILATLGRDDWVVLLAERGAALTTLQLAARLGEWQDAGRPVAIVIGGPDGVDDRVVARADESVSLGHGTYPHGLVRVMLAEQLYRAWSVNAGHPYHRA